jgi:hypothetical protein
MARQAPKSLAGSRCRVPIPKSAASFPTRIVIGLAAFQRKIDVLGAAGAGIKPGERSTGRPSTRHALRQGQRKTTNKLGCAGKFWLIRASSGDVAKEFNTIDTAASRWYTGARQEGD